MRRLSRQVQPILEILEQRSLLSGQLGVAATAETNYRSRSPLPTWLPTGPHKFRWSVSPPEHPQGESRNLAITSPDMTAHTYQSVRSLGQPRVTITSFIPSGGRLTSSSGGITRQMISVNVPEGRVDGNVIDIKCRLTGTTGSNSSPWATITIDVSAGTSDFEQRQLSGSVNFTETARQEANGKFTLSASVRGTWSIDAALRVRIGNVFVGNRDDPSLVLLTSSDLDSVATLKLTASGGYRINGQITNSTSSSRTGASPDDAFSTSEVTVQATGAGTFAVSSQVTSHLLHAKAPGTAPRYDEQSVKITDEVKTGPKTLTGTLSGGFAFRPASRQSTQRLPKSKKLQVTYRLPVPTGPADLLATYGTRKSQYLWA